MSETLFTKVDYAVDALILQMQDDSHGAHHITVRAGRLLALTGSMRSSSLASAFSAQ